MTVKSTKQVFAEATKLSPEEEAQVHYLLIVAPLLMGLKKEKKRGRG